MTVDGVTLSTVLRRERLSGDRVLRYGRQIASAMAHAHDRGVLHKDLKATNVLLTRDGIIKVVDFGIARRLGPAGVEQLTEGRSLSRVLPGTPPYMAPEVLAGTPADVRSDIWSLGVLLYEMAAGVRPFAGTSAFEIIAAILHGPPAELATMVRPALQSVIRRCLAVDPVDRFQTAAKLHAVLDPLTETAVEGGNDGAASRPADRSRRWRRLAAASLVILLPLTAGGRWPRRSAPLDSGGRVELFCQLGSPALRRRWRRRRPVRYLDRRRDSAHDLPGCPDFRFHRRRPFGTHGRNRTRRRRWGKRSESRTC